MKVLCLALVVLVAEAMPAAHKAHSRGAQTSSSSSSSDFGSDEWIMQRVSRAGQRRRNIDVVVQHLCSVILENELRALADLVALQGADEVRAKGRPCVGCDNKEESLFVKFCQDAITDMSSAEHA